MAQGDIAHPLGGCTVLVVHENRFRGAYLAEVLRGAGAGVAGPVDTAARGIALLEPVPMRGAMVLSSSVAGPYLESPFAGFQVVEALAQLLQGRAVREAQRTGPRLRGH